MDKKTLKVYSALFCTILLFGCDPPTWDVLLYKQKIEGTSKVLYKYDAWGGRDSNVNGFVIKDSLENFEVDFSELLPFYYLTDIPNKDCINGVMSLSPEDSIKGEKASHFPFKISKTVNNGISLTVYKYKYKGFSERNQGYKEYHFENFEETRDSIFFYNLDDIISLHTSHLDSLKFKKTNVFINRKKDSDIISEIRINDLILSDKHGIISNITYDLTPKNNMDIDKFSDYGIFKEVIVKEKK